MREALEKSDIWRTDPSNTAPLALPSCSCSSVSTALRTDAPDRSAPCKRGWSNRAPSSTTPRIDAPVKEQSMKYDLKNTVIGEKDACENTTSSTEA
eukprot:374184-Pleurochrysis_carterae.AAC.1